MPPLFSIGIQLHQPVEPSVFGSAELALQPGSQKEDHCGPRAEMNVSRTAAAAVV